MTSLIIAALVLYAVISFMISVMDLEIMAAQTKDLNTIYNSDFYESNRVLGFHNIIFFPSLLIIGIWMFICKVRFYDK